MKVKRTVSVFADTYVSNTDGHFKVETRIQRKGEDKSIPEIEGYRFISTGLLRKETRTYEVRLEEAEN